MTTPAAPSFKVLQGNLQEHLMKIVDAFRAQFHANAEVLLPDSITLRYSVFNPETPQIVVINASGGGRSILSTPVEIQVKVIPHLHGLWEACGRAEQRMLKDIEGATSAARDILGMLKNGRL